MKFVIAKAKLLELVGKVQHVVGTAQKTSIPILSNVLVEAANDELVFTTSDMTVGIRCYTEAKILEEGAVTLPARRLFQLIRELPDVTIEVATDRDDMVQIVAGGSRFRLHGMHPGEFPALPDLTGAPTLKIPQASLHDLLHRTAFAVSREDNRYVLTGVYCHMADGKATFIATDGKRVTKQWAEVAIDPSLEGSYVFPIKAVEEVLRALSNKETEATIYVLDKRIAIEADSVLVVTKLLSGDYPQVDEVIPKDLPIHIALHREEMITLLRQIALFTNDEDNSVRFTFTPGELTVSANTMDVGEGKVSMPVNFEGSKLEIGFNPHFFLDILQRSSEESVQLQLTDPFNPGLITDSTSGLFMLMPVRLDKAS